MIPASLPVPRPPKARLLAVDGRGSPRHLPRSGFLELLSRGDLLVANDAANPAANPAGKPFRTTRAHRRTHKAASRRAAVAGTRPHPPLHGRREAGHPKSVPRLCLVIGCGPLLQGIPRIKDGHTRLIEITSVAGDDREVMLNCGRSYEQVGLRENVSGLSDPPQPGAAT